MNPCDHPHGGGNGKKSKKKTPRTPWGKFTNTYPIWNKRIKRKDISFFYKL
jgi:ribosomal protein L2